MNDDDLTPEEREIVELVDHLRHSRTEHLMAALRHPDGHDRVRRALATLGELNPSLLVQLAMNALLDCARHGTQAAKPDAGAQAMKA